MKFLPYLISYIVYPFSFLFPRKSSRWVFGEPKGSFSDSAKYLFIDVSTKYKDIEAVWLSKNKDVVTHIKNLGFRAHYIYSFKGALMALTSKYWFFTTYTTDILFPFSGKAVCINLWHGIGLKRIEFNIKSGVLAKRYNNPSLKERFYHPEIFRRPDYMVSSSPFQSEIFAKGLRISMDKMLNYGMPRNEILTWDEKKRNQFLIRFESAELLQFRDKIKSFDKVYIYMPTWRDSQRELFLYNLNLDELNEILKNRNEILILKPHINVNLNPEDIKDKSNVVLFPPTGNIYSLLPYTDVLITDYSSISYDYLLMENKRIIFYLYDYEQYISERAFMYTYEDNIAGHIVRSYQELLNVIKSGEIIVNEEKRKYILEKFWGNNYKSLSPCENIIKFVIDLEK